MSIRPISIRSTLIAAFAALTLVILGLGGIGLRGITSVNDRVIEVNTNWLPSVRTVQALSILGSRHATNVYRHILLTDNVEIGKQDKVVETLRTKAAEMVAAYETLIASEKERTLYVQLKQAWQSYLTATDQVLALSRERKEEEARRLMEQGGNRNRLAFVDLVDQLVAVNVEGAGQSQAESAAAYDTTRAVTIAAIVFGALLATGLTILIMRTIGGGIESVVRPMTALAGGDLSVEIPHRGAKTEIGTIADAVQIFKERLIAMRRLEEETVAARAGAETQRRQGMRQMADDFEAAVGSIIGTVGSSATQLEATARAMTVTANTTATQSITVAAAAEEAATNVGTVAAAAEELGSSVHEIGRQVQGSASLAAVAVQEARETAALVQELSSATTLIGDVVNLISNIAGQTNLLALNATIEAARAGEAGRGFAVVASEVKELAGQTARATGEIGTQIARIQNATGNSVKAIDAIRGRIDEISNVAASIAAAVEEQGAATQEIVRNVAQAATGTGEVTSNIAGVAGAAEETGAAATQVLSSASDLSRQSEHLRSEVGRFLSTIRAA